MIAFTNRGDEMIREDIMERLVCFSDEEINNLNGFVGIDKSIFISEQSNVVDADKLLKEAKQEILQAHNAQTKVIQAQVSGEQFEYSLLFVHAQDTVMTITTELRMVQKMEPIFKALYQRSKGE